MMFLQSSPKFPVWIIEHVWAYKIMDIKEVVDPSSWPDVDSQPLSLEDSWRLRVVSAQVYSIIKSRDMDNFERVVDFLDTTYRLLPRLVPGIKHMKIMFGLKTMVIMWMLKEDKGMIEIVSKISQFFPNKLPQYQDQCSQREMFLMRKNHLDFKSLAQTLAINKDRLKDYMKNQMEQQYGEHYAQKVEDRLLHYLHELETSLPGDTYIDKILKKQSPVTEEEKFLLEVITSDAMTIAATLRKLLRCDVAACHPARISQPPVCENKGVSSHVSLTTPESGEGKTAPEFQPDVFRECEEAGYDPSKESPVLLENESSSDVREHHLTEEVKTMGEERSDGKEEDCNWTSSECGKKVTTSPQFCTKHQRWVKNILRGCPDNCSEELLRQTDVSSSPLLFQSSSSTSSSQDLTLSDLVPTPTDQLTSQTPIHQAPEIANTRDKTSSGSPKTTSDTSQTEPLPQPKLSKKSPLPPLLSPVVRLVDISSFWRSHLTSRSQQTRFNHLTMFISKQESSTPSYLASSRCCTSRNKDPVSEIKQNVQTAPVNEEASTCTRQQLPAQKTFSKLSRRFRESCATTRHSQALKRKSAAEELVRNSGSFPVSCPPLSNDLNVSKSPTQNISSWTTQSENMSSSAKSSQQVVHQNSDNSHLKTCRTCSFQSKPPPCFSVISSTSNLPTPFVLLKRLSTQECLQASERRSSNRQEEPVEQGSNDDERTDMEENTGSSFDVNILYSSLSSNSEDSVNRDPDYRPNIRKTRLLLEYESARIQNHT